MLLSTKVNAECVGFKLVLFSRITDEGIIIGYQGEFLERVLLPVVAGPRLSHEASHRDH
jgi:hypothetical protein